MWSHDGEGWWCSLANRVLMHTHCMSPSFRQPVFHPFPSAKASTPPPPPKSIKQVITRLEKLDRYAYFCPTDPSSDEQAQEEEKDEGPAWTPRDPTAYTGAVTFNDLRARVQVCVCMYAGTGKDREAGETNRSPPVTHAHLPFFLQNFHPHTPKQARAYCGGYERFSWVTGERLPPLPGDAEEVARLLAEEAAAAAGVPAPLGMMPDPFAPPGDNAAAFPSATAALVTLPPPMAAAAPSRPPTAPLSLPSSSFPAKQGAANRPPPPPPPSSSTSTTHPITMKRAAALSSLERTVDWDKFQADVEEMLLEAIAVRKCFRRGGGWIGECENICIHRPSPANALNHTLIESPSSYTCAHA